VGQTGGKILNLIPGGSLRPETSLVMVNAVYFKAPWSEEFEARLTKPQKFRTAGGAVVQVPFMYQRAHFGYRKERDYEAVSLPYYGGAFQFTVVLPAAPDGLGKVLTALTPAGLTGMKDLPTETKVKLHLPKLRLAPASASLVARLQLMGLRSAFDQPPGSADFSGIAERTPSRYLALRDCYHRTFLTLDERGTQAVAATALSAEPFGAPAERPAEVEVRVDRPFVFAIQHRESGVCLFLGVVADPR
jgi:serpin B